MRRFVIVSLVLLTLSMACNLPGADTPAEQTAQALARTETVLANRLQQADSTATPLPTAVPPDQTEPPPQAGATACQPIITSNVDVNVRGGPGTVYPIYGYIPIGGTAQVAGRNDAGTWWYVAFPAGPGGYGWVWGDAVTPDCIPAGLQVVAAPPTPEPPPDPATATMTATNIPFVIGTVMLGVTLYVPQAQGDIVLQDIFLSTGGEILVRVAVQPTSSLSGSVQYKVWVDNTQIATITQALPAGSIVFWTGHTISGSHSIRVKLDTSNQHFETDESNNEGTVNCNAGFCH